MGDDEEEVEIGEAPVPPSLAWTDMKLSECKAYLELKTPEECLKFVAEKMKLTDMNTNAKSAVMVDLYLWVLEFAKGAGLSEEKTSIFFTILKMTHEYAVGGKQMEESFEYCKRLLLIHSIKGVEGHVSLLTQRDVQLFTDYITSSYMQHYRLYQYIATHEQGLDLFEEKLFVCTAFPPPPLESSTMDPVAPEASGEAAPAADDAAADAGKGEGEAGDDTAAAGGEAAAADPGGMKALEKLIEEKTKIMQENFEKKLEIKAGTINAKLEGLGA